MKLLNVFLVGRVCNIVSVVWFRRAHMFTLDTEFGPAMSSAYIECELIWLPGFRSPPRLEGGVLSPE